MGPRGAAKSVTEILGLSKKLSPAQIYRCLLTPHRCGAQEQCQVIGKTYVGFLKPPDSYGRWKVRQYGAFSILQDTQGLRPKDQSCHHEVWLHLALVNHHGDDEPRERHEQRLLLKERSSPYQPSKERSKAGEDESERSLSS